MGLYALCTGYINDKYKDSDSAVSQSKINQGGNQYAAMNCFAPGIEINPADGEFLVIDRINGSDSFMVSIGGINQNIAPSCARGERLIYSVSSDGKTKKAAILFKNDGTLVLNGGDKTAVHFAELKTGFDKLKEDFNNFLSHTHPGVTSGSSSTGAPTAIPSTASIDDAESDTILLP
jgi:hypothetical protein